MNLGGRRVVGSMSYSGSNPSRKPVDVSPDQFPAGLRVLVVDDDPTCLRILEKMLRTCRYEVTKCDRAEYALNELRRNRNGFDIVLSDVHMPDMDGFKLLEHIGLEMDLPVIMMSADDSKNVVMKGVTHGACDYLIKPVRIEALKNIWQHVVRKKKNEWKEFEQSGSLETDGDKQQKQDESEYTSPATEGSWKGSKRKGGEDDDGDDKDDTATLKKPRVVWSVELHQQFVAAVNQLGIDKAVPKKILELMNVPGLTRENVASHLQKYRLYLRRLSGVSQHPGGPNNSFMNPNDPSFGALSALGGIDLQTLAVAGQIPPQTLAAYQPGLSRPAMKQGISMPFIDQRNIFSFESPKLRFGDGQHLQHLNNSSNGNKQMNLLHGIPTNMEPKHLSGFHSSPQSMGSMNLQTNPQVTQSGSLLIPMVQNQARPGHMMGQNNMGSHPIPQIQSSISQTMSSAGSSVAGLPRNNLVENDRGVGYGSTAQSSTVVDFSVNHINDLPGNGFPLASTPTMSSLNSKGLLQQEDINSAHAKGIGGPRGGFNPSYDIFNELPRQQKPQQDWHNNVGLNYGSGSHQQASTVPTNSVNVSPSVLVNQGFSSGQRQVRNGNSDLSKSMYLSGIEHQQPMGNVQNNSHIVCGDNISTRVKTERDQEPSTGSSNLYPYQYGQDDLMAILKQQEAIGPVEGDFDFDGYTLDNIPV